MEQSALDTIAEATLRRAEADRPTQSPLVSAPGMLGFFGKASEQRKDAVQEGFVDGVVTEIIERSRRSRAVNSINCNQ